MIRNCVRLAALMSFAVLSLALAGCGNRPYDTTEYQFAGRTFPPSKLANRVMVSVTNTGLAGSGGTLQILDAARDTRYNVYNVNTQFSISGFSGSGASRIFNFPEQQAGYVYSSTSSATEVTTVDYGGEKTAGTAATLSVPANDVAVSSDGLVVLAAQESAGSFTFVDRTAGGTGTLYPLAVPGIYKVAMNPSHTVLLGMVRNSNTIYRIVKVNTNQVVPTNAISCLPFNQPVYCAVPVPGTYDRPYYGYTSPDGARMFIMNCGPECGGTTASVSSLSTAALLLTNYDTTSSPALAANIPVPGGATVAISDGTRLFVAGQQLQSDGLFSGVLTAINLTTNAATSYSISDGTHTKMLFAENNTLWIGSNNCAAGERYKTHVNYNCLTRFDTSANTAGIVPAVDPTSATATVPYPNENLDKYYYGSLTGLCWVQNLGKIYTAYGGQVHAFSTSTGAEIDNTNITVQGVALDVAYLDALTNLAN